MLLEYIIICEEPRSARRRSGGRGKVHFIVDHGGWRAGAYLRPQLLSSCAKQNKLSAFGEGRVGSDAGRRSLFWRSPDAAKADSYSEDPGSLLFSLFGAAPGRKNPGKCQIGKWLLGKFPGIAATFPEDEAKFADFGQNLQNSFL